MQLGSGEETKGPILRRKFWDKIGEEGGGVVERVSRDDKADQRIAQNEIGHYPPADSDSGGNSRRGKDSHRRDEIAESGVGEYEGFINNNTAPRL